MTDRRTFFRRRKVFVGTLGARKDSRNAVLIRVFRLV
jgi:hypothetical protein